MANVNFSTLEQNPELAARVEKLKQLASEPCSEQYLDVNDIDLEAWNHVGDPLCEAVMAELKANKMLAGDKYTNARKLQAQGNPAAIAFFADVEAIPSWLDFDAMQLGARMAARNPIGMLFGMHGGLPFTYIDPATAFVMGSTGRLAKGGDYRRRFWETATGFVGALDVEGMKPGGARWELWIRVRFLHTMIRMGILHADQWKLSTAIPIGQVASAATGQIFGPYRVNIIRYFGGKVSKEEEDSFALMWRWIARLEGANNQLLGRTHEEQFLIQSRMHQFLYSKSKEAVDITQGVIDGASTIKAFHLSKRMHTAIVRRLLSEEMLQTLPGYNFPDDLELPKDRPAALTLEALSGSLRLLNKITHIPPFKKLVEHHGLRFLDHVVEKGLDGIRAEYQATPIKNPEGKCPMGHS
ncbi:oxygenase MpaB family protein [Acinetobacter proteolyticus]|uniref:oxygenase MpaB family protein n=1 Tax=Acinetobacter proteolyticus TaxID=1776741 RepID=UPI003D976E02